jgi:hypothetical protein
MIDLNVFVLPFLATNDCRKNEKIINQSVFLLFFAVFCQSLRASSSCYSKVIWYMYISPAFSHFYGIEYDIWAGFGPVGSTEDFGLGRKVCYFCLLVLLFYVFYGQKITLK